MRIARVLTRLNLGGPARQVLASDPLLVARGHDVRVFCGRPEVGEGDLSDALRARRIQVVAVPGLEREPSLLGDARALAFLRRELAAFAPNVVHTHASKAGLLGRLAAPRGAARVHTFHGHVLESYFSPTVSRAVTAIERRLARSTDLVVAVSRATRDDLVRLRVAPADKIVLSPPGVGLDEFLALAEPVACASERAELGLQAEAFVVGFIGRLAAVKRPAFAGAVLEQLVECGVDARLVVAGDGPLRAKLCAAAGAHASRVLELGARHDLAPVFAACDAVLSCSRNEGLPVALIEAAAAARPVVALDVGGVREIVDDGATGLVLAADATPLAVAEALAQLARDPERARAMGAAARERSAAFAPNVLADRLEQIYCRALAARACRTAEVHTCGS